MRFSCEWLSQYVDLPASEELARRLTMAGLAVEYVEPVGDDTVLDIDVTTNRPDCMNHLGLAREIAVLTGQALRHPEISEQVDEGRAAESIRVTIEDPDCQRYVARVIQGVKVGPSPDWLRRRLEAIGSRSINNVVDITNYVLWETGQPLHAFDLATIRGGEIRVRSARPGESLKTLDGEDRTLDESILVIADAEDATALGGVMGGLASEVTERTVDVLLESGHFSRLRVRKGSNKLGIHTDASHRFERGADPEACRWAADRAADLLAELAGGEVVPGAVDAVAEAGLPPRLSGRLELGRLRAFAGLPDLEAAQVETWMEGLGFQLERAGEAQGLPVWSVDVPSWRTYDFEQLDPNGAVYEADFFEEVVRIHGFESIPATLPAISGSDDPPSPTLLRRDLVRRRLAAAGYAEAINYAFQSPDEVASFPPLIDRGGPLRLANPLSELYSTMRRSLLPGLVESARFNQRHGAGAVRLFEVGAVFNQVEAGGFPEETEALALIGGGGLGSPWDGEAEIDFYDVKGCLELIADHLAVELSWRPVERAGLLAGTTAEILLGDQAIGSIGRVSGDDPYPLYAAELRLDVLPGGPESLETEVPSRFPGVAVDLTLTHALEVSFAELRAVVDEVGPDDLGKIWLKDRYRGEGVPEGAVNTTLGFFYNAPDRSLTQDEVNTRQSAVVEALESRHGWKG